MMSIRTPVVMVNFKIYRESIGKNALELAKICEEVALSTGKSIVVNLCAADIYRVSSQLKIPVWGQHADAVKLGSGTGYIPLEVLAENGATGTLINHSENRLKIADIEWLVAYAKKIGLQTCVCTNNDSVSAACAVLKPDFIAVEPPELIGGDISVTTADPEVVRRSVELVKKYAPEVKVLCGAGVKTGEDVRKAIELGTDGVLLASGVTKAKDPKAALINLVSGI
ncbi:MAG: triose-phosphate isomerase [Thermoplasmata archaeon]